MTKQKSILKNGWAIASILTSSLTIVLQYTASTAYLNPQNYKFSIIGVAIVAIVAIVLSIVASIKTYRWWRLLFVIFVIIALLIATSDLFTASFIGAIG